MYFFIYLFYPISMASAEKVRHRGSYKCFFIGGVVAFILLAFTPGNLYAQISTCSGSPFNYLLPNAANGTTYTWTAPVITPAAGAITGGAAQATAQSAVSGILTNTTTAQAFATYNVTPSSGASFQLVVTVNPLPVLSSSKTPPAVCSGTSFSYTPTSATNNTSFSWSRLAVTGISNPGNQGTTNPNEILLNTTINPITVQYSFTLTANGCTSYNENVNVVINPTPNLSSTQTPPAICSGTTFNYSPTSLNANTFTWTRAAVAGISNPSGSGNNNIGEVLVNTTLLPVTVTYVYTLTNNSQNCPSNQQVVKVNVNPVPVVIDQVVNPSCSGNTFISSPNNVPLGTLYTWTNPIVTAGSISGGTAVQVGQLYVGQALTNNNPTNSTIRYTVTPNANSCLGNTFFVDVTVNTTTGSTAVLSNPTPSGICSGATFNYQPQSATSTSYTWKRFYNTAISQAPSNGASPNPVNEPLSNITTGSTVVYYAISLSTANGCINTQTVPVSVNPPTVLSSTLTPVAICSNTVFNYAPTSTTPGTIFSWTRATVAGISNSAASGINNPSETLINTTSQVIIVTYKYDLSTPNSCVNSQNVVITINPTPSLSSSLNPPAICSGTNFNYTHVSTTGNGATAFSWSRAVIPNISNGPGNGTTNPSELLVNSGSVAVSVPYAYVLTSNGCSNNQIVTVVVNPTPNISNLSIANCSNVSFTINPSNVPAGTQYTWGNPVISPVGSISGSSAQVNPQNTITQLLVNQTLNPASATYTISPNSGACSGSSFILSVTVNPVPVVANQILPAVCSGIAFNYTPAVVPAATTYTWSSPVQSPFNSLTGASAQPINQTTISQILSSSNNVSDSATYSVTPAAFGCTGNVFTVTVPVSPVPVVNNIIDTICTGSSFSKTPGPVPANTTYTWPTPTVFPFGSVVGGSARTIPASTISQILVNATNAPGQVVYDITPTSGSCAGSVFTLTEVVGNALPAFPNRTAVICSGTSFDVTPATAPANTTYTWNIPTVAPAGSVVGLSAMNVPQKVISQTLTNIINLTDTVVYTILPYNTGCKGNLFTATIRVLPLPKATITGKSAICRYPVDTLTINFTGTAPWSFTYTDYNVVTTQTGITTSPFTWVVPITPNVTTRQLAISPVKDFACTGTDTSYFIQKINPLPVGQIISLHGIYICNNTIDTLLVSSSDSLGYQWTRNTNLIVGATTDSIATLSPGSYNALLTNRFGCVDTAATPVTLYYVAQPVVRFLYDSYCINNIIRFTNITDTSNIGLTQWVWDFGDGNTSNAFNSTDTYRTGGDHHVRLTANQLFCPAYSTSADSTLNIQFPIPAMRMPSVSAYKGQFTPLNARALPAYRYRWNPTRGIDYPDSASVNFNFQNTQEYLINLISPAGCITQDTMLVRVFDDKLVDILVPKSFTPNGDGVNDVLYPYLTGIKTFQYFKVYNRFGKLMFETNNPDAGWNGSLSGTQQPMAIYIWVSAGIAADGSMVQKKGETLLLR